MARIRSAKPEFWTDPRMCALPRDVRWTFKGLWEVCADDDGRFLADARLIKGQLWPMDDDITARKLDAWLVQLETAGRIRLYVVDGIRYGVVVHFLRHQKISHPTASRLPPPPRSLIGDAPEKVRNTSGNVPDQFRPDLDLDREKELERERERETATAAAAAHARAREEVREQLPADHRDDFDELLGSVGGRSHAWVRSLGAVLSGELPVKVNGAPERAPPHVVAEAIRQFNANISREEKRTWLLFDGYMRRLLAPERPPGNGPGGPGNGAGDEPDLAAIVAGSAERMAAEDERRRRLSARVRTERAERAQREVRP